MGVDERLAWRYDGNGLVAAGRLLATTPVMADEATVGGAAGRLSTVDSFVVSEAAVAAGTAATAEAATDGAIEAAGGDVGGDVGGDAGGDAGTA